MAQDGQRRVYQFTGGVLCLDFANTVSNRLSEAPGELLGDYGQLASWAAQAGIVSDSEAVALQSAAVAEPGKARAALKEARAAREEIHAAFASFAGRDKDRGALAALSRRAARHLSRASLKRADRGFTLQFPVTGPAAGFDGLLGPIVWSAFELLLYGDPTAVKVCGDDRCGWLFLDESKNHSRRWCSMKDCGNRAKAQRHYRRARPKLDS